MTREIKFRAKSTRYPELGWIYWDIFTNPPIEIIPESLGQYIGLEDKNNKPIFTGDILNNISKKDVVENITLEKGIMLMEKLKKANGETFTFNNRTFIVDNEMKNNCGECGYVWGWSMPDEAEIIQENYIIVGNIFDSPELLK